MEVLEKCTCLGWKRNTINLNKNYPLFVLLKKNWYIYGMCSCKPSWILHITHAYKFSRKYRFIFSPMICIHKNMFYNVREWYTFLKEKSSRFCIRWCKHPCTLHQDTGKKNYISPSSSLFLFQKRKSAKGVITSCMFSILKWRLKPSAFCIKMMNTTFFILIIQ
jgi:hypothetical protein